MKQIPKMGSMRTFSVPLGVVWVPFLLSLLPLCHGVIVCGTCEKGSSLACPSSLRMQYEIELMEYDGHPDGGLRFRCDYSTTALNLTWLSDCSFPSVSFVRIQLCPLFNESVGNVLRKIGVNPGAVKDLWWETMHSKEAGLQPWHLESVPNLTTLVIQSNNFTSLPRELLKNTPRLESISIRENSFNELPDDIFSYTPNITSVELISNKLTSLPTDLLYNLSNLTHVSIIGNTLPTLPSTIFKNNPELELITFSSNKLETIEDGVFSHLKKLYALDMRINSIRSLPENVFFGCANLTTLYLMYNSISEFPSKVFEGTKLKYAYLGFNKLVNISTVFNDLPTLQNLTLHRNDITSIPKNTFRGTHNIVRLDLQGNLISSIEEGAFANLNKMRLILLNQNSIPEIPNFLFSDCAALLQVYLQNNKIPELPLNIFPQNAAVQKLDLSHNAIRFSNIYVTALNKLTSLQEINLSHNRISYLHNDFHFVLLQLKVLDLSYNQINALQGTDISFLSPNVSLNLQNNNISSIRISRSLQMFNQNKLLVLRISGNPLSCDCSTLEFLQTAQIRRPFPKNMPYNILVPDADEAFCASPESLAHTSIPNVDPQDLYCDYPCSSDCECYLRPFLRVLDMDCNDRYLTDSPILLSSSENIYNSYNVSLDLSGNEYSEINFVPYFNFTHLVNLTLANNSLSAINETVLPSTLKFLDLRDNNFTNLPERVLNHFNQSSLHLYLGSNPWNCDCDLLKFQEFLRDNFERVIDRTQVLCADTGAPIQELTPENLCPFLGRPAAVGTVAGLILILLLVAILLTAAWYRHKELIKVWLYSNNMCLWAITETEIDADKKYDAFVSYSYKDESFVNNVLVPELEAGNPPYKICLHYRDWIPGEYIQDQILNSVKASRRTLVVLSKNFLESVWGQLEFKAAHSQALKDKTNRIIVIVYGDVPEQNELDGDLKLYVTTNTYLKWGDPRFWDRLKYAMPHAKYAKKVKKSRVDKLEMVKPAPLSEIKTIDT